MKPSQKLTKQQIEPYFLKWNQLSNDLAAMHTRREKKTKVAAQAGIVLYKQLLRHCQLALQDNNFEPLNGAERLFFIETSASTYAAYRQLDELFLEVKKTLARKRIEYKQLNE